MSKGRMIGMAVAAVAVLATIPSLMPTSAKKKAPIPFAGSITMLSPTAGSAVNGASQNVTWSWKPGTMVKSTSRISYQVTKNGTTWETLAGGVPIRNGQLVWNTTQTDDAVYAARVLVEKTTIASAVNSVAVDNTAPAVHVTHPSQSEVLVENDTKVYFTVVVGSAELDAAAFDALSGIDHISWQLDAKDIVVTGAKATFNFGSVDPGFHDLTATAFDRAGNSTVSESVKLFTAPGPSALGTLPSPCPTNPANGTPADPCTIPTTPPAPPTTCPVTNPVDNTPVADPCAQQLPSGPPDAPTPPTVPSTPTPTPPSQPTTCPVTNPVDHTVVADPCKP